MVLGSAELFEQSVVGLRSEPLFLATTIGLFCLVETTGTVGKGRWLLVAAMSALAVGTRTVGLALVAAAGATLLQRSLRRGDAGRTPTSLLLAVVVGGSSAAAAWWIWTSLHATPLYEGDMYYSYSAQFRLIDPHRPDLGLASAADIAVRIPSMLGLQLTHGAELVSNIAWLKPVWSSPLIGGAVMLALVGIVQTIRAGEAFAAWYLLAFAAALSLWPYDEKTRFVLPALPWLLFFIFRGARMVIAWWRSQTTAARRRTLLCLGIGGAAAWTLEFVLSVEPVSRQECANLAGWLLVALAAGTVRAQSRGHGPGAGRWLLTAGMLTYASVGAWTAWQSWSSEADPAAAAQRLGGMPDAIAWLEENAAADASVMCEHYATVHLTTGLHTTPMPRTANADVLRRTVLSTRPDFLIVQDRVVHAYYQPFEQERFAILENLFPGAFRQVHDYRGGKILACDLER